MGFEAPVSALMLVDVSIRIRDLARSDERARLWKAVEGCGRLWKTVEGCGRLWTSEDS